MKIGDKLYCHTDFYGLITGELLYTSGNEYTICDVSDPEDIISITSNIINGFATISLDTGTDTHHYHHYNFYMSKSYENDFYYSNDRPHHYYGTHFHSTKEYRKLKLKKLNEV